MAEPVKLPFGMVNFCEWGGPKESDVRWGSIFPIGEFLVSVVGIGFFGALVVEQCIRVVLLV